MRITVTLTCENAAFGETDAERFQAAGDILHELADTLAHCGASRGERIRLVDANGNTCGMAEVSE